jgi:hypothetical protein
VRILVPAASVPKPALIIHRKGQVLTSAPANTSDAEKTK